ncbi:hypothetical protein C4E22_07865, partial [ANME-1 cluster archaeon AG-394-G06]|nr:hypothetical protein [ANME-1 cluster archaeon AG-394-G06]
MYVPYQSDELWNALLDAAKSGIESGVKSVIKDILSAVGEAVLEYFSPAIADLFFNSDESDAATQRIVDEIRDTHSDLADRHREVFEEIQDMYSADIIGSFETAFGHLEDWISHSDPILRMETLDDLPVLAIDRFTNVRETLEEYIIRSASDARAQFQRLQLLSQHIEATRLELTTRRLYWNWMAIKITFESEHGESSTSTIFEEWRDSLSQEEMDDIQDLADGDGTGVRRIYDQVLSFYETLSDRDDL